MKPPVRTPWEVFRTPLALAAISGVGLVAALLNEGSLDLLWSLAVAAPVLVVAWKVLARRRG